jgi:pilus assembly protein FimV
VDEQLQPLSGNGPTPEETRELGFEIPAGPSATLSETANLASEAENLIPYEPPSLPASDIGPTDFDDDSARSIEDLLKELSAIHFEEHLNGKPAIDGNPGIGRGEEVSGSRSALDDAQIEPRHEIPSTGDAGEPADLEQKLDLARAYVDMADFDQARVILSEVIAYGTPEQRSEAEELSARLASL